jgi:hypothetical protein
MPISEHLQQLFAARAGTEVFAHRLHGLNAVRGKLQTPWNKSDLPLPSLQSDTEQHQVPFAELRYAFFPTSKVDQAIQKTIEVTTALRDQLQRGMTSQQIQQQALLDGMTSLQQNALYLAIEGRTSIAELQRTGLIR